MPQPTSKRLLTEARLGTDVATVVSVNDKAQRAVTTSSQVGAFVKKMRQAAEPTYCTLVGDSTSAATTGWFNQLVARLGLRFPAYTVKRYDFDHTNQRYNPIPTVVQTGTGGRRRLVNTGASTDKFFTVADSPATSPTTALDVRAEVMIPAGTFATAAATLCGKYDTVTNNRSWFVQLAADGKLNLFFSTDGTSGTQLTRASSVVVPPAAQGVPVWLRVTFQGDNGASGNDTKFYFSLDNQQTWVQIGSTVTAAGVQSIFDGTAPTQFVARSGAANATGGAIEYYGFELYSTLAAGARPIIKFNTDQWNGYGSYQVANSPSAQFVDFVGNTVQAAATGSTGAMVGAPVLYVLNGAVAGQAITYANDGTRFPVLTPVPSDLAFINFSHNEIGTIDYRAPYKQLADALVAKWPDTGIVATIQNQRKSPAANIVEHAIRSSRIASLAGSQRWAVIDIASIFADTGTPNALVQSDGIHPEQAGYDLAAQKAELMFTQWLPAAV